MFSCLKLLCNNIFDRNILSRGYQTKLEKHRNSKGLVGYDKHPHLLTTMPCLKRDETCWCTEAFISKRSTIFNCESVRLPNARLWSTGKSFGWVQLFDYWTQLKSIEQLEFNWVRLTTPRCTAVCSSNKKTWKLVKLQRAFSNTSRTRLVIHKIFGTVTFKNLLVH